MSAEGELDWLVIVPVKRLDRAKTRLRGTVSQPDHQRLVLAMAMDTVAAAMACPLVQRVIVVTDDPTAGPALRSLGAEVVPDGPGAGLNQAISHAASVAVGPAVRRYGLATLPADLPALRPAELAAALAAAQRLRRPPESARSTASTPRGYVPDAAGAGTVLLAAPPGACLSPAFGPDSAAAHAASGAVALAGDWPGLRRDVDTLADLAAATVLGLGTHTVAARAVG